MDIEDIYMLLCTDEVLTGYLNPYVELWCSFDEEKHITFVFTLDKKGFFRNNNTTLDKIKLFEERLNFIIDGIIHDKCVELEKCVTKFDTVSYKVYIDTDKTDTRLRSNNATISNIDNNFRRIASN
ncbi:hypothetical protein BJ944DRAFT_263182 [Cunninghamella echinulata]|nr:hypothetical protein BJ944DRAFT_263182 [Cunninghamella echinulata]